MPEKKGSSRDLDAICFGLIVKRLRMQKGWTLQQLSFATGFHANYLGVIERGGNTPSLQSARDRRNPLAVPAPPATGGRSQA
jgi:ribosome-binding protein aMBF1 (putative translation factor)